MQTRYVHLLLVLPLLLLIQGCGPVYLPAIYDSNPPNAAPHRFKGTRTYGSVDANVSDGFNNHEWNALLRASYTRAGTWSWGRWSFGGFGYGGNYRVLQANDHALRGHQGYGGFGVQGDVNVALVIDKVALGIGANMSAALEGGPYVRLIGNSGFVRFAPLIGGYTFLNVELPESRQLAFQLYTGLPGLVVLTTQLDLGPRVFWLGYGTTLGFNGGDPDPDGRISAGVSMRFE